MISIQSLLLSAVLANPSNTVLLDFTSDSCTYCDQMQPTVRRLETDGLPVRHVNISRDPSWAEHYQIEGVPTYVMLSNGREVGRIVGRTSYDELTRLYERAGVRPGESRGPVRTPAVREPTHTKSETQFVSANPATASAHNLSDPTNRLEAERAALDATVRVGVEDERFRDFATGTIIDVHGDEALVLTCGHVFRDSKGQGRITVDLFSNGKVQTVPGKLIDFVADNGDVGLLVIRAPFQVKPVQVAAPSRRLQQGEAAFTVGCDDGNRPTLRHSKITYINRYNGSPPNIEAAGVPVKGRSGGGLFTADGTLIGVCNAADAELREGVYAALPQIYQRLDKLGLAQVYRRGGSQLTTKSNTTIQPVNRPSRRNGEFSIADATRPASLQTRELVQDDVEVICVIRSKKDPSTSHTIVLNNPPADLVNNLRNEYQRQRSSRPPATQQPVITTSTSQPRYNRHPTGHVLRAQSE